MSQGKAWDKGEVLKLLEEKFRLGMSAPKACKSIGFSYDTFKTWTLTDEELRLKIGAWQSEVSDVARKNWNDAIEDKNHKESLRSSQEWLRTKESDEFTEKKGIDHTTGGEKLNFGIKELMNDTTPKTKPEAIHEDSSESEV